ncbi:MAG: hypothetical protein P8Y46_08410, partial [Sulfurovaceae bacterium]
MKKSIFYIIFVMFFMAGCTQETQNSFSRSIQNWTGTNGVLEIYAGDKLVHRFIEIDKISTAASTTGGDSRPYRYGYGYHDVNLDGNIPADAKKVYFEFSDYSDQITRLSKQRRLAQFGTDTEQFKGLMNNALALQEELNLEIGVSLTQEQIAALDSSIVWMEFMDIDNQTVLAPVVYLAGDINDLPAPAAGPQISGRQGVDIQADTLNNQGDIASGGIMKVSAQQLANNGGRIQSSDAMELKVDGDIVNTSGEIAAGGNLDIEAERLVSDRYSQETTNRYAKGSETQTELGAGSRISSDQDVNINT